MCRYLITIKSTIVASRPRTTTSPSDVKPNSPKSSNDFNNKNSIEHFRHVTVAELP